MKKITAALCDMPLCKGLSEPQIQQALESFHAYTRCYDKGTYLLSCGQPPQFGLVIAGEVHIIKEDFWGHRSLLAQLGPGALFGESFSLSATPSLPVSVLAGTQVEALFFRAELFFQPSVVSACSISLVTNLLRILAEKNQLLTQKIEHISKRSLRAKLLSYLSEQAQLAHNNAFTIPMNRQQLADYLCVDRSALSSELSKMRHEGLLLFWKNHFTLLGPEVPTA